MADYSLINQKPQLVFEYLERQGFLVSYHWSLHWKPHGTVAFIFPDLNSFNFPNCSRGLWV
ncbi:hypothetical protein BGZ60DRAFT_419442 [Tricladium varicosporioides]|nr:hypothetical protein BGZ60DRAFT_419442 [Hymenoscyphus varicosporioides]